MIKAADIRTVTVVGTGAIGASWATLALSRGLRVVATDPADGAEQRLRGTVAAQLAELGQPGAPERLMFTADLGEAAAAADLVLENGPERLDVTKRDIFAALDQPRLVPTSCWPAARPGCCRARSQAPAPATPSGCSSPIRSTRRTWSRWWRWWAAARPPRQAVDSALEVLRHLGKRPIRLRRELPGHVANRLQAALWREAYYLVGEGVVSVEDVDVAISSGPGLRWALLGPFATQHLSGGGGGLEHVLAHLGPPMVDWWHDLGVARADSRADRHPGGGRAGGVRRAGRERRAGAPRPRPARAAGPQGAVRPGLTAS